MNLQINHITKKAYTKGNQLELQLTKEEKGFVSDEWMTFVQAMSTNLKIKKGSQGTSLISVTDEEYPVQGSKNALKRIARRFTVFNLDQMEKRSEN